MKKKGSRVLALLLVLCLCVSLLPGVPARALTNGTITDGTTVEVQELQDIGSDFQGAVLEYHLLKGQGPSGRDAARIDVYTHVVDPYQAIGLRLAFDTNTVTMSDKDLVEDDYSTDENSSYAKDAIEAATIAVDELLTEKGKKTSGLGAGKLSVSNYILTGANQTEPNALFTLQNVNIGASSSAGTGMRTLEFTIVTNRLVTGIKDWYDGVDSSNYDFTLQNGYITAQGKDMKICSLYFVAKEGQSISDATFGLDSGTTGTFANGVRFLDNAATLIANKAAFVGFPAAPEKEYDVKFTVKAGSKALPGATVEITSGNSTEGTNVVGRTGTTDENGVATIKLPVSNGSGYRYKINDVVVDGTTYTMGSNATNGVSFSVSAATDATNEITPYTAMEEVAENFSVNIRAVDAAGGAVSLKGANVTLGVKSADTTTATALSGITVSTTSGEQLLQITGVPGYQNVNVQKAVTVTPVGGSLEQATLSAGTDPKITVKGTGNNQSGQYVEVKLSMAVTDVTMPLPVPQVDGKNITGDQAKAMTLTFVPSQKSSAALKAEVGSGVTVSGSAIKVESDAEGLATSISATASLPDGSYTLTVGGAGFDSKEIPVTVVTDNTVSPAQRVVNVGGDATLDDKGNVTSIEGGVTGSTNAEDSTNGATGNGKIDLSGGNDDTTIVEGGTTDIGNDGGVTPPSKTDPGVTDRTDEGLGGSDTANDMKPTVVTDPIYLVKVTSTPDNTGSYQTFKAEVFLKNAQASAGTFGMYYDPKIFSGASMAPNTALNIAVDDTTMVSAPGFNNPEIAEHEGNGYVFFNWGVQPNSDGTTSQPIDGYSGEKLIATITLNVKAEYWSETALKEAIDKRSIYTMDYTRTKSGQYITSQLQGADQEAYNEAMGGTWRVVGTDGAELSKHLEDSKATRGGFYQFTAPETVSDGENQPTYQRDVMHDIRMDFDLPDFITDQRVDFWVTERDGEAPGPGVKNAEIRIYEDPYDPDADPAMTPIKTLTTNDYGYAYVKLDQGKTYYYTVTEKGHWSYPNGTPLTDTDNMHYDAFRITDSGVEMVAVPTTSGANEVITEITKDYINPRMDPTTYHEVALTPKVAGTTHNVSLTSATAAYNGVDYFFTLKPDAGYEWKLNAGEDMNDIAAKLTATLYQVNKDAADETTAFRGNVIADNITITWDATKEKFLISGTNIAGDSFGTNTKNIDPLRAGDLDILVPDDLVDFASYKITASVGAGGTMSAVLPTDNATLPGSTDLTPFTDIQAKQVETLSGGRTVSSIYTFKPTGTNLIGKVVVNGVEQTLTEQQKSVGYTHQFLNVSSDQTIHVTFTDKDGDPLSDPYLSVTAGDHGSVEVATTGSTETPAPGGTVTGPATESFDLKDATGLTVTVKPDKVNGYEIDTVIVDGKTLTDDEKAAALETDTEDPTKQYYTGNLTLPSLSLNDGDTHSVVVTFKPKGEDSIQAIVTATVVKGFGTLSPVGITIYPIDATPEYLMTPADGWTVDNTTDSGAILVDGTDRSDQITAPGTGETAFRYTLPPLKGNTTLDATFSEKAYKVEGKIQIAPNVAHQATVAKATLTFKRDAVEGQTDATTVTIISDNVAANNTADSGATKLLSFTGTVPVGTWTVTVHKQGYLDYIIEGFEVKEGVSNTIYFGDSTCDGGLAAGSADAIKPIPLTPGDASGDGKAIAFGDASMVVAGWLSNALTKNKTMGDIDESNFASGGGSDSVDMGMVRQNMYKSRVFDDYATFCS